MMDYSTMAGSYGNGMMFFGWFAYVLFLVLLILGIIALWKYIERK